MKANRQALPLLIACIGFIALCGCASSEPSDADSHATSSTTDTEKTLQEIAVQDDSAPSSDATEKPATSQIKQSDSESINTPVDIEAGMTYATARSRLIQQGWIPLEAPEPGPYGAERTLYDAGFTEVTACSGTGFGPCSFSFYHPDRTENDNLLSVTTHNGEKPTIYAWSLHSYDAIASAAESSPEVVGEPLSEIPPAFRGKWNISLEDCSRRVSDGLLVVESNRLQFYGSSGPVLEVTTQSDSEITVTVELSDEGFTSVRTITFLLSSDGSDLIDFETDSVRRRCPSD